MDGRGSGVQRTGPRGAILGACPGRPTATVSASRDATGDPISDKPRRTAPRRAPQHGPPCPQAEFPRRSPAAGVRAPHQPEHRTMSQTPRSVTGRRGVSIPAPGRFTASPAQDRTRRVGDAGLLRHPNRLRPPAGRSRAEHAGLERGVRPLALRGWGMSEKLQGGCWGRGVSSFLLVPRSGPQTLRGHRSPAPTQASMLALGSPRAVWWRCPKAG